MRKNITICSFIKLDVIVVNRKSVTILNLHYHKLVEKIEENEKKKYLMINYNILDKVLDKIKEITGIEKFDDTKILIDTDDKLILDKLRF